LFLDFILLATFLGEILIGTSKIPRVDLWFGNGRGQKVKIDTFIFEENGERKEIWAH
jgi:hypothetical protein